MNSDRRHGGRLEGLIIKCVYYIYIDNNIIRITVNTGHLSHSPSVSDGTHTSANVHTHAGARTHAPPPPPPTHTCLYAGTRACCPHTVTHIHTPRRARAWTSVSLACIPLRQSLLVFLLCVRLCVRACVRACVCVMQNKRAKGTRYPSQQGKSQWLSLLAYLGPPSVYGYGVSVE